MTHFAPSFSGCWGHLSVIQKGCSSSEGEAKKQTQATILHSFPPRWLKQSLGCLPAVPAVCWGNKAFLSYITQLRDKQQTLAQRDTWHYPPYFTLVMMALSRGQAYLTSWCPIEHSTLRMATRDSSVLFYLNTTRLEGQAQEPPLPGPSLLPPLPGWNFHHRSHNAFSLLFIVSHLFVQQITLKHLLCTWGYKKNNSCPLGKAAKFNKQPNMEEVEVIGVRDGMRAKSWKVGVGPWLGGQGAVLQTRKQY